MLTPTSYFNLADKRNDLCECASKSLLLIEGFFVFIKGGYQKWFIKIDTKLAQIGNRSDSVTGTVNPPVYFSTAYRHEGIGQSTGFDYSRSGNPTRQLLEKAIADLEGADQGFACSSGMAAIFTILSLFQSGDEWIVSEDLYGGTYRLLEQGFKKWGSEDSIC